MFGIRKAAGAGITCAVLIFALPCALGQSDNGLDDGPEDVPAESTKIERVKPTIIAVRDDDGHLHPSPDITLEELHDLVRRREERGDPVEAPQFHFSQAAITGVADDEKATLNLEYSIVVHEARWVRVPLRLGGAIVTQSSFEGRGVQFIEYDEVQKGYYAWIKPDVANETHRVTVKVLNRVTQVGDEHRLEMKLPRVVAARDAPKMTLRVPIADAVATATSGSQACEVDATTQGRNTQLQISQPVGDFSLAWRSTAREATGEGPVVFDATSKIIVTWDSQSRVVWDASIAIHALRGRITTVQVELPPAARLLVEEFEGQRVTPVDANAAPDDTRVMAIVELDRPVGEGQSREIRLRCERVVAPRDNTNSEAIEIGGFVVEGAARQSGHIGVITADSLRANVTPGRGVYRQYEMPNGFHEAGVVGSRTFQFLSQPSEVKMSVATRERRIAAAPVYLLRVAQGKLSLSAHVDYRVTGRTQNTCSTIFPGWEIEKVELIEGESNTSLAFDPPTESTLDIDLPQPMRGEFGLRIEASQPLPAETDFFAMNLPSVDADSVETARLVVISESDLEVLLDADRSVGVAPSEGEIPLELPAQHQRPQLYRIESQPDASFAATIIRHQRQIEAHSEARALITKDSVSLVQLLHYDVRYQPVLDVPAALPTWLAETNSLQFEIDGEVYSGEVQAVADGEGISVLTLSLPRPRLGRITLTVRYRLQVSQLAPGNVTASPISLAAPPVGDIQPRTAELTVEADKDLRVELNDDAWEKSSVQFPPASGAMVLTAEGIPDRLELLVTYETQSAPRSTVVERTWVQTWLTSRERQDRAVFRIRTNEGAVTIRLPASATSSELMVLLDGQGVPAQMDAERRVTLPLFDEIAQPDVASQFRRHVVEIGWRRDQRGAAIDRIHFDAPTIEGAWSQLVRWHVLTPKNHLILFPPGGMAAEATDSPWWWMRRSLLTQHELERWSGASAQPSAESTEQTGAQRQYLFAGVGRAGETPLVSCSAALAMSTVCAGIVGLIAIAVYVPRVRHPGVLLVLSVAVAYLAWRWPTAGLFAGQTVAIALLVVLASQLLQRTLVRRRRVLPGAAASRSASARSSTRVRTDLPAASSPSTTAQAGAALPLTPSKAP